MSEAHSLVPAYEEQINFTQTTWLAQIFTPRLAHTIEYVNLKLEQWSYAPKIKVSIHPILGDGTPHPVELAVDYILGEEYPKFPKIRPRLAEMRTTFPLLADMQYAIQLTIPPFWGSGIWKASYYPVGGYPRGKLIRSTNAGQTWNTTDLGDLFFAEWGDPPLIITKPRIPEKNFAVLDIDYYHCGSTVVIYLPTSFPCHLTCYWTDKEPLTHKISRRIRGALVPWSQYFCFVAWHEVEQAELGDTLYHTFPFLNWPPHQKRWFTFRGNIDEKLSPSVGPIFEHINPGAPCLPTTLRPIANGDIIEGEQYPTTGQHWDKVDDIIPDEDATKIFDVAPTAFAECLFHLEKLPDTFLPISKLTTIIRVKSVAGVGLKYIYHSLKIGTGVYHSPAQGFVGGTYQYWSYDWTTNPQTGFPWTISQINNIQAGFKMNSNKDMHVTQFYATPYPTY